MRGRSESYKNRSRLGSESSGDLTIGFKNGFLFLEFFSSFTYSACLVLIYNKFLVRETDTSVTYLFSIGNLVYSVSVWVAVFYAYVADNYFGKIKVLFFVATISVVAPIVSLVTTIVAFLNYHDLLRVMYSMSMITFGLLQTYRMLWRIVAMDQLMSYFDLRRYVVLLDFLNLFGLFAGLTTIMMNSTFLMLFHLLSLLSYLFCYFVLFVKREKLHSEEFKKYTINRIFVCYFRLIREKIKILKNREETNVWFEVAVMFRYSINFLRSSKKAWAMFKLFFVSIPIYMTLHILWFVTLHFQSGILRKNTKLSEIPIMIILNVIILILMASFEFVILPLINIMNLNLKYFHVIIFGFACATFSIFLCCLLEQRIQIQGSLLPVKGSGQIRIYNAMDEKVGLESKWFPLRYVEPWESLSVLKVPTNFGTVTTNMSAYYKNRTETYNIKASDGLSYSSIITEKGFSVLNQPDPVEANETDLAKAIVYIISPLTQEFIGKNDIWFFYPGEKVTTPVNFPNYGNASVLFISRGVYAISMRRDEKSKHFIHPGTFEFVNGGVYTLLIMYTNGEYDDLIIKLYTVLAPSVLNFDWIYPQLVFYAVSLVLLNVNVFLFIFLESPPKIRTFVLALYSAMSQSGFGSYFIIDWKGRPSAILLLTLCFICFVTLIFFCYATYHYKSSPKNQHIFQKESDFF